ncbi:TPA: DUF1385 domain-containing protein [Candidatus Woesearchaeota archaeon]|nr:MAG: hypothetical protein QT07_C0002G0042 [archaeon GW2011_AR16]HIG96125.1 DUF1385 domain-containing protein [Candidatus Woesearchaeota archaeon]HII89237.1 DUF1385 domain-containing protein [Candidatus Woesearchaeota archaeon]
MKRKPQPPASTAQKPKKRSEKNPELLSAGGQAVIEGVMIRSKKHLAIAVRKPNGKIAVQKETLSSLLERHSWLNILFLRGIIYLFEMLIVGFRALNYSANEALDDGTEDEGGKKEELSTFDLVITFVLALGFAIVLFKFLPLLIAQFIGSKSPFVKEHYWLFNLIDGLVRILIFVIYLKILSFIADIRRLFQYHGAEHQAVHCYEARLPLTVKNVQKFSPEHPRCGTSFILIVLILSVFVYTFIPSTFGFWSKLGLRLLLLPVIAGISYELLKVVGKYHSKNRFFRMLVWPGMLTQKITTRKPTNDMVEVAIASLKTVLRMENQKSN